MPSSFPQQCGLNLAHGGPAECLNHLAGRVLVRAAVGRIDGARHPRGRGHQLAHLEAVGVAGGLGEQRAEATASRRTSAISHWARAADSRTASSPVTGATAAGCRP